MKLVAVLLGSIVLLLPAAVSGALQPRDYDAVFSPDGGTVAFVHALGSVASIDLLERDGSHRRRLVRGVSTLQHLAWSPDGKSIAYESGESIWRVDVVGGTPTRVTTDDPSLGVESWQPAWSPDGKMIAYSRFQTCFRCTAIWLVGSDGTSPRQIYDTFQARRPMFSPDGTELALSIANDLVIDLDGHSIVGGGGAYTIWSPRGTYIAYTGGGLWIRNLETGILRRLTPLIGAQIAWSPDGKWIAGGTWHVGRSRPSAGRVPAQEDPGIGHPRGRPELLARLRRVFARRRVRHRHRPRERYGRATTHANLLIDS